MKTARKLNTWPPTIEEEIERLERFRAAGVRHHILTFGFTCAGMFGPLAMAAIYFGIWRPIFGDDVFAMIRQNPWPVIEASLLLLGFCFGMGALAAIFHWYVNGRLYRRVLATKAAGVSP